MTTDLLVARRADESDPLFDPAAVLPLGQPFLLDASPDSTPSTNRPFGLRFVVVPPHPIDVDLSQVRYDTDRQMCVDPSGTPVFGRHTDGQTSTQTSDGYKSMDSDTDHRED